MKPTVVAVLALTITRVMLAIIWVAPAVRGDNSICNQYPYTSNGR